jgi:hypothetical protein
VRSGIKTGRANRGEGGVTYMVRCFLHDWQQEYPRSQSTQTLRKIETEGKTEDNAVVLRASLFFFPVRCA